MTGEALGPDEVRVRVHAAGLNRADLLDLGGRGVALPGRELAGEVIEVGSAVDGWEVGQRIMSGGAGFASEAVVRAAHSMPVPDSSSDEEACFARASSGSTPSPTSIRLSPISAPTATSGSSSSRRSVRPRSEA